MNITPIVPVCPVQWEKPKSDIKKDKKPVNKDEDEFEDMLDQEIDNPTYKKPNRLIHS